MLHISIIVDEPMDYLSSILRGECGQSEYQCARSMECISASFLCDFKQHCLDGSDEEECGKYEPIDYLSSILRGECGLSEYQCARGRESISIILM